MARGTLSGMAAGLTTAVARGGRVSIQQVATDAFGNALGNGLAYPVTPQDSLYSLASGGSGGQGLQAPSGWGTPQGWNSGYDEFLSAFSNPSQMAVGSGVQIANSTTAGVILDSGAPAGLPHVNLPSANFMPVLPEVTVRASDQPDTWQPEVTVKDTRELMTVEDLRRSELEYRNRTETLSEFDRNIARAQGLYDAGAGMLESAAYSFGVVSTQERRAQWAMQTAAATVQGVTRLWNEPSAVFNEWKSNYFGNDPAQIRQASAQATGVGLGVVSGLRGAKNIVVRAAEMPGPMAGSRAAQLGGVKIAGEAPSKTVNAESRAIGSTETAQAAQVSQRIVVARDFNYLVNDNNGILSTISKEGIVDFKINAVNSPVRGVDMFDKMMVEYGGDVSSIRGNWMNRDVGPANKNLGVVNNLTAKGVPLETAVTQNWTAQQAARNGFTSPSVKVVVGEPGAYTKVETLFTKP